MAASIVHIPLAPMTLEINAVSSEYVTWTYRWKDVDLSADFETYSQNFGHPDGWVWRMLFQQNVDSNGNRMYGIFLYVVMTDHELQERSWTRDIRYLQFAILNSDGRQLKDKTTVATYRENQLSWGFPGLLDNSILLRDPVVNSRRTIDIVCRLRYHPDQEKMRRPLSPSMTGSILSGSIIGANHPAARAASSPASYWDQKANPTSMADSVGKNLRKLLNDREFSDLEIVVGPERYVLHGHKAILAARSEWFRSVLRSGFREAREGRITLSEDDPKIFEALMEFLYTGEYPLSTLEPLRRPVSKMQDPIHLSPRTPPIIPPRVLDDTGSTLSNSYAESRIAGQDDAYDYLNQYEDDDLDEQKYMLYIMADKYGVSELKTLIRLHLTNELLDISATSHQGPRLLRLIRFAFEELPESTTPIPTGKRDSGLGSSLASPSPLLLRGDSPHSGFPHGYPYSGAGANSYPISDLENREGTASAFGHPAARVPSPQGSDVGVAMTTERRSTSRISHTSTSATNERDHGGVYGRDNETALLREAITAYVAKMFHTVRQLDGFDELLREGGEMGGFVKMVMDNMYRP